MITPEDVVYEARSWMGTPFAHQGRQKGRAADCIGLVIGTLKNLECLPKDFNYDDYGREPLRNELSRIVEKYCVQCPANGEGILVLMRWFQEPQHCGILTADQTIVHSYQSIGRVVEHGYRGPWVRRSVSFWKLPGVTYE